MNLLCYLVLAYLSVCYPCVWGRLPTRYSPVRRSFPKKIARLACVRHAASVHPEPGSNSQIKVVYLLRLIIIWISGLVCLCLILKELIYVNLLFNFQSSLLVSASLFYQSYFSLSTTFFRSFSELSLLLVLISKTSNTIPPFKLIVNTFYKTFLIFYLNVIKI